MSNIVKSSSIDKICSLYLVLFLLISSLIINTEAASASNKKSPEEQKEEKNILKIIKTKEQLISQLATGPANPEQLKAMLLQIMPKENTPQALIKTNKQKDEKPLVKAPEKTEVKKTKSDDSNKGS